MLTERPTGQMFCGVDHRAQIGNMSKTPCTFASPNHAPTLLADDMQSRIAGQVSAGFKHHSTARQAGAVPSLQPYQVCLLTPAQAECMAARLSMQGLQW